MWVLIILWRICERYEPCTFTWKALFQACLVKRAFSWKCIGRQPGSEGILSRAVHGVTFSFAFDFLDLTTFLRQIPYLHHTRNDTTLIKLRQRYSKLAVQVLYYFVCIHAALSPFRIFYINSASCRPLFSQITVLNHIQQNGSSSTMFYI